MKRGLWLALLALLTAAIGTAAAQTVINPTLVEFDPSADHARVFEGLPLVDKYTLEIYLAGAAAPITTADLGKPTPEQDGKIRATPTVFATVPIAQRLEARVLVSGSGGQSRSGVSNPFGRLGPPAAEMVPAIKRSSGS